MIYYSIAVEYLLSNPCTFLKNTAHFLDHKVTVNKGKKKPIISSILSDYDGI